MDENKNPDKNQDKFDFNKLLDELFGNNDGTDDNQKSTFISIEEILDEEKQINRSIATLAKFLYRFYTELYKAGFNEKQALYLTTKQMEFGSMSSKINEGGIE